jgi:hypothetical protein
MLSVYSPDPIKTLGSCNRRREKEDGDQEVAYDWWETGEWSRRRGKD